MLNTNSSVNTGCLKGAYKVNQASLRTVNVNQKHIFINFTLSNLKFEPWFVRIRQILIEIWLFEHEFQQRNFGQLRIFGGIKFAKKTV